MSRPEMKTQLRHTLPAEWHWLPCPVPFQRAYAHTSGLRVIESPGEVMEDGRVWHHVSFSRADRVPSWEDTTLVKDAFCHDRTAFQILPPRSEWVNIHSFTLHLWTCLDEDGAGIPRFGRFGTI